MPTAKVIEMAGAVFDRIRENITKSFECRRAALEDIVLVHERRMWKQLGYESFEACLEVELKMDRFPLKRSDRREAVAFLDAAGLTTRAIAAALGIAKSTAHDDQATVRNRTVEPVTKVGLDGKSRPAKRYPTTQNQSDCLTPKLMSVLAAARDLGTFAQEVGAQLCALGVDDLADLTMEDLEGFANGIYRSRHGLKICQAKLP